MMVVDAISERKQRSLEISPYVARLVSIILSIPCHRNGNLQPFHACYSPSSNRGCVYKCLYKNGSAGIGNFTFSTLGLITKSRPRHTTLFRPARHHVPARSWPNYCGGAHRYHASLALLHNELFTPTTPRNHFRGLDIQTHARR